MQRDSIMNGLGNNQPGRPSVNLSSSRIVSGGPVNTSYNHTGMPINGGLTHLNSGMSINNGYNHLNSGGIPLQSGMSHHNTSHTIVSGAPVHGQIVSDDIRM